MIEYDAAGRPYTRCPREDCRRLHLIRRVKNYESKAQQRFRCGACGTTWKATEAEQAEIAKAYQSTAEKRKTKGQTDKKPPKNSKDSKNEKKGADWASRIFGV